MRRFIFASSLAFSAVVTAQDPALPPEVAAYIEERDICEHFINEPFEGDSPEQVERRMYIFESIEIYCPGTDRRLAALKARYADDPAIMERLGSYDERIE